MRQLFFSLILMFLVVLSACSGGNQSPTIPTSGADGETQNAFVPVEASDVLYNGASGGTDAYKAFGIYNVVVNPSTLTAEILPARNAEAIGHTFDADLTQFLIKAPCYNCLQIGKIKYLGNNQVQIGFSVKHPFSNLTARPDLHGFDVRGIVIADGDFEFPHVMVALAQTSFEPASGNVEIVANADGYTHHFDELAEDVHYYDPPRFYEGNINPFRRYFVNPLGGVFNPLSPTGHNVMPTGANWETQDYIFNIPSGSGGLEFAFVVDCAYGQSATFANRNTPYYFLPEFNRKEAWKADVSIVSNSLKTGDIGSSAQIRVTICDWQAGLAVDPNYPNTSNLVGLSHESDVTGVELEIPSVCNLVEVTNPTSGNGSNTSPYIFDLTATNTLGADADNYYGIVAVRDTLQGNQGPMAIPASAVTFAGPEIYDYSVYNVFSIRVNGSVPTVDNITFPGLVYENSTIQLNATVTEPDGDTVTYFWEQTAPATPEGVFIDPTVKNAQFSLPDMYDIPISGIQFTVKLTATDPDGSKSKEATFTVLENNYAPLCLGIETVPYRGVIGVGQDMTLSAMAVDPNEDELIYEWDFSWDGMSFNVEDDGQIVIKSWDTPGFNTVACRITEDRINAQSAICSKMIIVEGFYDEDIKIDESSAADPDYYQPQIAFINGSFHATWLSNADYKVLYSNDSGSHDVFGHFQIIGTKPTTGNNRNPQIAGVMSNVIIAWVEYDTSAPPNKYRLKIRRSQDGGLAWQSPQTLVTKDSPDALDDLSICAGAQQGQFVIFYEAKETAQIKNYVILSSDNGVTWTPPSGGGQFRDVFGVGDFVSNCSIVMARSNVMWAMWLDGQVTPPRFLFDWSNDGGVTWHTDIVLDTTADTFVDGNMVLDMTGSAYFVTLTDTANYKIKKATFTTSPSLSTLIISGFSGISSVDIWVSGNGKIIAVPLTSTAGVQMYYSNTGGSTWGTYPSVLSHSTGNVYDVIVEGSWLPTPDRDEILFAWVDNRGGSGQQAHIYGNLLYMSE